MILYVNLFPEREGEWRTIRGKFLAINAASMSCACPRSPKGLSPAAHLADGTTDLILVRKCSRFDFLRHLLRHTSKDDQVTGWPSTSPLGSPAGLIQNSWRSVPLPLKLALSLSPALPPLLSLTWTSSRSIGCGVSASHLVTARVTRTWSWTCGRTANAKSSARSVETTRLAGAPPPTAAGTATAKSWPTRPLMSGTAAIGAFACLGWPSAVSLADLDCSVSQGALPVDQTVCTRDWRANRVWGSRQPLCDIDPHAYTSCQTLESSPLGPVCFLAFEAAVLAVYFSVFHSSRLTHLSTFWPRFIFAFSCFITAVDCRL